jgi:hypothetical protein
LLDAEEAAGGITSQADLAARIAYLEDLLIKTRDVLVSMVDKGSNEFVIRDAAIALCKVDLGDGGL